MLVKGIKDARRKEVRQKGIDNRPLERRAGNRSFRKVSAPGRHKKVDIAIARLLSIRSGATKSCTFNFQTIV